MGNCYGYSDLYLIPYKNPCTTAFNNMATAEIHMGCEVMIYIFAQNIKSLIDRLKIKRMPKSVGDLAKS